MLAANYTKDLQMTCAHGVHRSVAAARLWEIMAGKKTRWSTACRSYCRMANMGGNLCPPWRAQDLIAALTERPRVDCGAAF